MMNTEEIISKLQSRIDRNSHQITEDILLSDFNHHSMRAIKKRIEGEQALDKRIMAELINLRRQAKWYSENV